MAMRMPPQVAQQPVVPEVNRTSLVLFGGLALIVLQFYWANGPKLWSAIFHSDLIGGVQSGGAIAVQGVWDATLQIIGLVILVGIAQYGGENAGTAALMFIGALWLLWLLAHFGTTPKEAAPTHSETTTPTSGGSGGQKL